MSAHPLKLSDARMAEALALLEDADSVELKVTVNDTDQRSVIDRLKLDVLEAELRQGALLTAQGIDLTGQQQTKTQKALAHFARVFRGNGRPHRST